MRGLTDKRGITGLGIEVAVYKVKIFIKHGNEEKNKRIGEHQRSFGSIGDDSLA